MEKKKVLYLVYVILLGLQFSACTRVEKNSNLKLSDEINHDWKVIDANPKSNMDISAFGEEDGTIYFEDNNFYGGLKVSRGYEKFKKTHSTVSENEFKDLKQFNMALKKVGYKVKNMNNFYFFEDSSEESEMCFVLVENGEKLVMVTPLNIWNEEQNYSATVFKKVKLKE